MDWIGVIGFIVAFGVSYLYIKFAITPKGPDWRKLGLLAAYLSGLVLLLLMLGWFF